MPKKTVQDLILEEIKDINTKLDKVLDEKIPALEGDIKVLKYKSSLWGGIGGLVGGIATFLSLPHRA
jgi:hypothetical protein